MESANNPSIRSTTINISVDDHDLTLIDRAAAMLGKTRAEFVLDTCRHQAQEILLYNTLFVADDTAYEQFVALVDNHTPPTGALRNLLQSPSPWEQPDRP